VTQRASRKGRQRPLDDIEAGLDAAQARKKTRPMNPPPTAHDRSSSHAVPATKQGYRRRRDKLASDALREVRRSIVMSASPRSTTTPTRPLHNLALMLDGRAGCCAVEPVHAASHRKSNGALAPSSKPTAHRSRVTSGPRSRMWA
jgi:hypothetical protein